MNDGIHNSETKPTELKHNHEVEKSSAKNETENLNRSEGALCKHSRENDKRAIQIRKGKNQP